MYACVGVYGGVCVCICPIVRSLPTLLHDTHGADMPLLRVVHTVSSVTYCNVTYRNIPCT